MKKQIYTHDDIHLNLNSAIRRLVRVSMKNQKQRNEFFEMLDILFYHLELTCEKSREDRKESK